LISQFPSFFSDLIITALMLTAMPAQSNAYTATSIIDVYSNADDADDDGEIKSPKGWCIGHW